MGVENFQQLFDRGEAFTRSGLPGIHECFGIEKVGIDQRRKQHANPQRETTGHAGLLVDRYSRHIRQRHVWAQNFGGRLAGYRIIELLGAVLASQPCLEAAIPVVQSCVVSSDDISKYPRDNVALLARDLAQVLLRPHGARSRMRFVPSAHAALDMRIGVVGLPNVLPESYAVFAEVMPYTGKPPPIFGIEERCLLPRTSRHRKQMVDEQMRLAVRPNVRERDIVGGFHEISVIRSGLL